MFNTTWVSDNAHILYHHMDAHITRVSIPTPCPTRSMPISHTTGASIPTSTLIYHTTRVLMHTSHTTRVSMSTFRTTRVSIPTPNTAPVWNTHISHHHTNQCPLQQAINVHILHHQGIKRVPPGMFMPISLNTRVLVSTSHTRVSMPTSHTRVSMPTSPQGYQCLRLTTHGHWCSHLTPSYHCPHHQCINDHISHQCLNAHLTSVPIPTSLTTRASMPTSLTTSV